MIYISESEEDSEEENISVNMKNTSKQTRMLG